MLSLLYILLENFSWNCFLAPFFKKNRKTSDYLKLARYVCVCVCFFFEKKHIM
jgi:hypothetical protein